MLRYEREREKGNESRMTLAKFRFERLYFFSRCVVRSRAYRTRPDNASSTRFIVLVVNGQRDYVRGVGRMAGGPAPDEHPAVFVSLSFVSSISSHVFLLGSS